MSTSTAAAVLAKIAGLSAAGKATVGVVIAAGVVGVAASAPAIADQFTGSVTAPVPGVTSSAEASESADAVETEKPEATETPEATESADAQETEAARPLPTDLPSAAAFGQSVAADARDGGVEGPQIAARAHERNDLRRDAATPEPSEAPDASESADATESADVHAPRVLPTAVPTAAVSARH